MLLLFLFDNKSFLSRKKKYIYIYMCGGVKPGPMMWAQEQRFINNTPEEKKS